MPKKTRLKDLNEHLFAQIERLGDEDLCDPKNKERLALEIERSRAMSGIAKDIISSGSLALQAMKAHNEALIGTIPEALLIENGQPSLPDRPGQVKD